MSKEAYEKAMEVQTGAAAKRAHDAIPTKNPVPLLISSPYSNELQTYNKDAMWSIEAVPAVDYATLENLTNTTIDRFVCTLESAGITVLRANGHRFRSDFDRKENSYNPALSIRPLPYLKADEDDIYAAHGMGVVWQRVPGDIETPLYLADNEPTEAQISGQLIGYKEFHSELKYLINAHMDKFGASYHISLQPFSAAEAVMFGADPENLPQFIISDDQGKTSGDDMTAKLAHTIQSRGYLVARNEIFPTGELTKRYASADTNAHSVQLKINEALYWNADTIERSQGFAKASKDLHAIFATMAQFAKQNIKIIKESNIVPIRKGQADEIKPAEI